MADYDKTIGTSQDYSTIQLWLDDLGSVYFADFVANSQSVIGRLAEETFNEDQLQFNGATTDTTYKWKLLPQAGAEHNAGGTATVGGGAIIESDFGGGWGVLTIDDDDGELTDLELRHAGTANDTQWGIRVEVVGGQWGIKRCIIHGYDGDPLEYGIRDAVAGVTGTIHIENCWIFNVGAGNNDLGVLGASSDATLYELYNCTVIHKQSDTDVQKGGVRYALAKNCCVGHFGPTGGWTDYLNLGTGSVTNASHDSSGDTGLTSLTMANELTDLTDYAMDLHIKSDGTKTLVNAGTAGVVSDDIDGVTRTGTLDVGADEFVAAAAGNPWYAYAQQ